MNDTVKDKRVSNPFFHTTTSLEHEIYTATLPRRRPTRQNRFNNSILPSHYKQAIDCIKTLTHSCVENASSIDRLRHYQQYFISHYRNVTVQFIDDMLYASTRQALNQAIQNYRQSLLPKYHSHRNHAKDLGGVLGCILGPVVYFPTYVTLTLALTWNLPVALATGLSTLHVGSALGHYVGSWFGQTVVDLYYYYRTPYGEIPFFQEQFIESMYKARTYDLGIAEPLAQPGNEEQQPITAYDPTFVTDIMALV